MGRQHATSWRFFIFFRTASVSLAHAHERARRPAVRKRAWNQFDEANAVIPSAARDL